MVMVEVGMSGSELEPNLHIHVRAVKLWLIFEMKARTFIPFA
jgi:hypothetical protein